MIKAQKDIKTFLRPPIVTILGHVDHGKTTLLDSIRKTNIAQREVGGITQHIGAYQISTKNNQKITFIDTPGHEAFAKMRVRGAMVADIAVLVVAANDGVMPQTLESLSHINNSNIPCIVAINKIDLATINIEKVKKQLLKAGLNLDEYGGDTPVVPISAIKGENIHKLLDMILLVAELNEVSEDQPGILKGVVIESEITANRGPVGTVVLRSGNLNIQDIIICEKQEFKVRAIFDWNRKAIQSVTASDPCEILGWKSAPAIGSIIIRKDQNELIIQAKKEIKTIEHPKLLIKEGTETPYTEKIKLIIKSDTSGTLEAINEMLKIDENIIIIYKGIGSITESDVFLAKTTNSIIIGFHQKTPENILKLAETEKVIIKTYNIIYELIDEIGDVVEAIKHGNLVKTLGESKILAIFNIKDQIIAGVKIINGRIARGDQVKIVRNEIEIGRAKIKSLRHGKEDITKADQGMEAGIILSHSVDLLTGDSIISIG